MSVTSLRITPIFGWAWIVSVTARGKSSRATPRAPPAGTEFASAQDRITDPSLRSSSFKSPEAVSRERLPSEFEQTSSAKCSVRWAGVSFAGRISHSSTEQPRCAACQAASLPASPAPKIVTSGIEDGPLLVAFGNAYFTPGAPEVNTPCALDLCRVQQSSNGPYKRFQKERPMGRRRDYEESYEDARRDMMEHETGSRRSGDGAFTAVVFIKYAAIVIVVLVIAYVVLRILRAIQAGF